MTERAETMFGEVRMVVGETAYTITRSLKVSGPNGSRNVTPTPSGVWRTTLA